jgi:hypothetical protein
MVANIFRYSVLFSLFNTTLNSFSLLEINDISYEFRFDSSHPGWVFTKEVADSEEKSFFLFNCPSPVLPTVEPQPIKPPGLDQNRQEYLYDHVREFVPEEWRDVLCPPPKAVERRKRHLSE